MLTSKLDKVRHDDEVKGIEVIELTVESPLGFQGQEPGGTKTRKHGKHSEW